MQQIITPNPHIPCKPGWCLMYVRQAFGLAGVYPSATAGWAASNTKHRDMNFPSGVWLPLWFFMADEPLGHVVLRAPDGSIYSTTDLSNTPRHHPNLADLMRIYAGAGLPLTYLGWTEDIENVAVVDGSALAYSGTITPVQEDDIMTATPEQQDAFIRRLMDFPITQAGGGRVTLGEHIAETRGQWSDIIRVLEGVDEAVLDTVVDGVAGDKITLRQLLAEYRAHIIQVVSGIAAEAAHGGASIEEIQKAIADGINIQLTINGKEAA